MEPRHSVLTKFKEPHEIDMKGNGSAVDNFKTNEAPTIVLRLYEAFGGHGTVKLKLAEHLSVVKVLETNLLEDELKELSVYQAEDDTAAVKLDFHGFEVKTIKLVLGKKRYVYTHTIRPTMRLLIKYCFSS